MMNFRKELIGVWIGQDIEIVRTNLYEIVFKRNSLDQTYESRLYTIHFENNKLIKNSIGMCKYDCQTEKMDYSMIFNREEEDIIFKNNDDQTCQFSPEVFTIENKDNGLRVSSEGGCTESFINRNLYLYSNEHLTYVLEKDEDIEISDVKIDPAILSQSKLEDCLKTWRMGTAVGKSYATPNKINPYVEITTKRHAYVFSISHDMVYCRAARYDTCDLGMVFAQNFRISQIEKYGRQVYMFPDNNSARDTLSMRPEYFDPNLCAVTPENEGGKMAGIYWSVKEKSDNLIILHGCRGDKYYFPRVRKDLIEFFNL